MSSILIVDDSPSVQETLFSILEGQGYELHSALDGPSALEMALRLQPDLILLDVMMPGMDGYEVCSRVRSSPQLAEVPVVMLTALDDRESLLRGFGVGADDFLSKPVDRFELRARVRTITRLNRYRTLLLQRENLRQMAEHLITAQEEERRRISRELHDDLGQALTSHMLDIRGLQNNPIIQGAGLAENFQALYQQSYEISVKMRQIARDLRPPVLDTLGLRTAMQTFCAEITRRAQLPITFEADEALPPFPDGCNLTLYRVLQEAINNIVQHAQASHAWVELG